jgi:DNA-binding GntR family transcriptional regulator
MRVSKVGPEKARSEAGPPPSSAPRKSPYEILQESILSGVLAPGQPLVETALAEWCQVSRTPIREALMRLEQDGLVMRRGRELVVRERSQEEILDIYETRIILEANVARVASARRTPLDVVQLRRTAESLSEIDPTDPIAMATGNRQFHQRLWRAGHNESLIDLATRLDLHLSRYPATTLSVPGRWEEANLEHLAIVDAVDHQDANLAGELAAAHFTKARNLRLELWAQSKI